MRKATEGPGVLLVDDEKNFLLSAGLELRSAGIGPVWTLDDSRQVLPFLEKHSPTVVVMDLTMPHLTGRELLPRLAETHPDCPVVVLTAVDDLEVAVECMRLGARDYLVKPVEGNRFLAAVRGALEVLELQGEVTALKETFLSGRRPDRDAFSAFVTASQRVRDLFRYLEAVAPSRNTLLITGETGVGKEIVARAVHDLSGVKGEFVALNAAGLEDSVFSDTLFGHVKGAYTGADAPREGLVSRAAGGTLFLDEIGDLRDTSQIKLLRLLQERQYYPLGADTPRPSTARVLVATNHDLPALVSEGRFRRDLFYRLKVHHVHLPPLRERPEDLQPLLERFLGRAAEALGRRPPAYPPELLTLLRNHPFPGNVRELEAMVSDAVARHRSGVLSTDSFREAMGFASSDPPPPPEVAANAEPSSARFSFNGAFPRLREVEDYLVEEALRRAEGNQTIAAQLLGISRQTLNKRLTRSRS